MHVATRAIFPKLKPLRVAFLIFGRRIKMPTIMLSASQSDDHSCTFFHKTFLKALIAPHVFGMRATKRQATHSVDIDNRLSISTKSNRRGKICNMERNTQQRQAILKVFEKATRPLNIQEIHSAAKRRCTGIGIATVYRNLKALTEDGKIDVVEMPGGAVLYELPGHGHHHHFSCNGCQKVFDVMTCGLNLQGLIPGGFTLQQHEILLSGLCNVCSLKV